MSLRWKIWLALFGSVTLLFGLTGWILQRHAIDSATRSLEEEMRGSIRAYETVWQARQEALSTAALLLSSLPNVRAAFGTQDAATIRDSAGELRSLLSEGLRQRAFFVVCDPRGAPVVTIAGAPPAMATWPTVEPGVRQRSGFFIKDHEIYQLVLTPVMVDAGGGPAAEPAMISLLVAGFAEGDRPEQLTGGEFVFSVAGEQVARPGVRLDRPLLGLDGKPVGTLSIFRTPGPAERELANLQKELLGMWAAAVVLSVVLSFFLARRIVEPLGALDRAATAIGEQRYGERLPVTSNDELGRLAATFNSMSESLEAARAELIRQERIATVGRLASSIVHDLRNPLAAIYGGAEMLVDAEGLAPAQTRRLAGNIYTASRRMLAMLQELLDAAKGKAAELELCRLREVVEAAVESQQAAAHIRFRLEIPEELELPMDRARMERVFVNLLANAIEVMPDGGEIAIVARPEGRGLVVEVRDQGPGIADEVRERLFQPFATYGKRNGLGLGLALSRQTVREHGGDLTAANGTRGAVFSVRLHG
jgi:signal transduction histidine kinase